MLPLNKKIYPYLWVFKTILVFTLFPMNVFASGDVVLYFFGAVITAVIVLLCSLLFIKWKFIGKTILFLIFITSLYIFLMITNDIPYMKNRYWLIPLTSAVPLFISFGGYLILNNKFRRNKKADN